ncbi:hypothetical protein HD593_008405 [Nonomuraea rubra]|uniref:RNA polymerase sigma-70 region 2 domain-containing protein n=1 Tax=Nonomuraea rubra TaxID=46180 RepID=A0A7X0P1L5_9ACTN|nr:hypothetical protein [Nonomuraea rubra]
MSGTSTAEDLLRRLAPQALGTLIRRYGDFDACEDAVQEALLAASVQWPGQGVPDHPATWLITVATRRLAGAHRSETARRRRATLAAALEAGPAAGAFSGSLAYRRWIAMPSRPVQGEQGDQFMMACAADLPLDGSCHDGTTPSAAARGRSVGFGYLNRRRRRLLLTTNTLENAIAAPAIIGLSRPSAASGRAATL